VEVEVTRPFRPPPWAKFWVHRLHDGELLGCTKTERRAELMMERLGVDAVAEPIPPGTARCGEREWF
jgi:hypothetical protein